MRLFIFVISIMVCRLLTILMTLRVKICNTPDKVSREYDTLGQVLKECGLKESVEKAIPPYTSMFF